MCPVQFGLRLTVLALCFLNAASAHAWGADGHRLIAELAESQLTPAAAAEVGRLLSLEPGSTMVSVSTWADEIRRPASAPLHYVNLPADDCTYVRQRDCADGRCLVEAINEQVLILRSKANDARRLVALKWVIHLVGDIHQPLHVGLASDKGGNQFQVRAFGRGSNLHAVWDRELIRRRARGPSQLLYDASNVVLAVSAARPADWANESCVARGSPGFYPNNRLIGAAYATQWDGELVVRLAMAARRLAAVLNTALELRSSTARR